MNADGRVQFQVGKSRGVTDPKVMEPPRVSYVHPIACVLVEGVSLPLIHGWFGFVQGGFSVTLNNDQGTN